MAAIRKEDIQDIISDIRRMLELRNDPPEAELQRLVQTYVSVIQQINSMLKKCLELVEKGLKSEAIMRSDENGLLELVSILDFPEEPVWVEYQTQFGFETPPAVDQFASQQINSCYAPAQFLEPLYRLNRRHALAKSPLNVRLKVMRQIHETEVGNAKEVAGRQVELFETERLKCVRKELADALRAHDDSKLKLLCGELNSKDWLTVPDVELVRSAVGGLRKEEAQRARRRMAELASQLQTKWSAQDVEGGRQIRENWKSCLEKARLRKDHLLIQQTNAAFAWLREIDDEELKQQRYDEAIAALRDGLDQRHSRESLELLEHALDGYNEGIPETLGNRLQTRYDELNIESGRRNVRRLLLASLSVIGIVGLATFFLQHRNFSNRTGKHQTAMTVLLERGDVESARAYADTLQQEQQDMLSVPQIKVLLLDIDQAEQNEMVRREAVESGVSAITEQVDSVATLIETRQLQEQLDALDSRGDEEIEAVLQLTARIEKRTTQIGEDIDNAFTVACEKAASELKEYEQSGQEDIKRFEEFIATFTELRKTPNVSHELTSSATGPLALVARCEARVRDMRVEERREQLLRAVTASVGSVTDFRAALNTCVKELPKDDRLALRIDNLLRTQADFWPRVDVQNEFVRKHSVDCVKLSPIEAREYLSESMAFLNANPQFEHRAQLNRICDYLRFVSGRVDEDGEPVHAGIMDQLDKANLKDLYIVLMKSGQRHYTNKEPEFYKGSDRFMYFPLPDWLDLQRQRNPTARNINKDSANIRYRDGNADWEAPESLLIREIERELNAINDYDWERVMLQILERVYNENRQDPIFRLFMLRTILETAVAGSQVISERYSRILIELRNEALININPFDPDDDATNLKRKHASDLLKPVLNPATVLPELIPHREALSKLAIGGQYRWLGWLNRDATGWVCVANDRVRANSAGDLHIYTSSGTGPPGFQKVGNFTSSVSGKRFAGGAGGV